MTEITLTYNNEDYTVQGVEGQNLKLYKKASEVGNPKSVKTPATRTIKIPKTSHNRRTYQHLGIVGGENTFAYEQVDAKIISEGVSIFWKAKQLVKDSTFFYSAIFKEGVGNFFDEIEGKSIRDIDFSDLVETWNITNIIAANTNTEGVIYPVIDFGLGLNHPDYVAAQELLPAVFFHTILERIFDQTYNASLSKDYKLQAEVLTNTDYLSMLVPLVEQNITQVVLDNMEAYGEDTSDITSFPDIISFDKTGSFDPIPVIKTTDLQIVQSGATVTRDVYNVLSDGIYSFTADVRTNMTSGTMTAILFQNTTQLDSASITLSGVTTLTSTDINCSDGDFIFVEVRQSVGVGEVKTPCTFECTSADVETIGYDLTYPVATNLPDISQVDFIKEWMSFFALLPDYDIKTNTCIFRQFSEITDKVGTSDVNDLSEKIVKDSVTNDYNFKSLGVVNNFKWSNDSKDSISSGTGESSFTLVGQNYTGEKDFVKSLFSNSKTRFVFSQLTTSVPSINVFSLDEDDARIRTEDFAQRIFLLDRTAITLDYSDDDGSTTTQETTDIPLVNILGWSDFQTNHYTEYIAALNSPDTPNISLTLSIRDFLNIDIYRPFYINELKGYYFGYDLEFLPNNISKLKLLKLK